MSSLNEAFSRAWVRIVRSFRHLPMPARWGLARCAAAIFWQAVPKRRHVILTNLRLCFPELSEPKSRRKPSRKLFRNEFSNKNSVKLTDFFVDFNSVRMI